MIVESDALSAALRLHRAGQLGPAIEMYEAIVAASPENADAWALLGAARLATNELERAAGDLRRAIKLAPNVAAPHANLGTVLVKQGAAAEGVASLARAVELQPDHAENRWNLARAQLAAGESAAAAETLLHVMRLRPADVEAQFERAKALAAAGERAGAIEAYQAVLALRPDHAETFVNLGLLYTDAGQLPEAAAHLERAVQLRPALAEAYVNLGHLLVKQERFEEAVERLEQAVRLKASLAEAHHNLGSAYAGLQRQAEAVASFRRALELRPNDPDTYFAIGSIFLAQLRPAAAVEAFDRAIELKPDLGEAHFNRAAAWLLSGDFARGWAEYEWRWRCKDFAPPRYVQPKWDGSPLSGRTILLHAEQGLGDTLQFVRYAPLVKARGAARVVLECPALLKTLMATCTGVDEVVTASAATPPSFDVHCPLMSLPHLLSTGLDDIPAEVPYLRADPELTARIRARCDGNGSFNVGIVWRGNPKHRGDRARSVSLADFAPLSVIPGVRLFSLQKGPAEREGAKPPAGMTLSDWSTLIADFSDTAAAVSAMDLVIAVDTAVVHLAGALGKAVWTLLPFAPDWRWLLERTDTPWYPSMRLYRQPAPGDWAAVMKRVAADLSAAAREKLGDIPADADAAADVAPLLTSGHNRLKRCRHGLMLYNWHDTYVGRSLDLYGEFSEGEVDVFRQVLRPGDVVLDVGANIGAHSVFMAKAVGPGGRVLAFEPQRLSFQTLCANVALNGLVNVECRRAAAGDAPSTLFIPVLDPDREANFGGFELSPKYDQGDEVPVVTLDSLNLSRCRLLKVDVEGMESNVLRGARGLIARLKPMLYVENDRAAHERELIQLIHGLGYHLFWHLPPLFNPNNYLNHRENVFGRIVSRNMLCVPSGTAHGIRGLPRVDVSDSGKT